MFKLKKDDTILVIIDMQEKLSEVMDEDMFDTAVSNTLLLAKAFNIMNIPVIETLQYPKGLGDTAEPLKGSFKAVMRIEKTTFSAYGNEKFIEFLEKNSIKNVVIAGMEAHICVLQTALDLLERGYGVHIAADAVISRNDFNWETGLDMAQNAGAVVSVAETVIYQLLGRSDVKEFKDIRKLMK